MGCVCHFFEVPPSHQPRFIQGIDVFPLQVYQGLLLVDGIWNLWILLRLLNRRIYVHIHIQTLSEAAETTTIPAPTSESDVVTQGHKPSSILPSMGGLPTYPQMVVVGGESATNARASKRPDSLAS